MAMIIKPYPKECTMMKMTLILSSQTMLHLKEYKYPTYLEQRTYKYQA